MTMQPGKRLSLIFKICLPLLLLIALQANPISNAVSRDLRQARSAQQDGQPQVAADALRRVADHEPWRASALWDSIGQADYQAGRLPEAVQAWQSALRSGSLSTDSWFLLGDAELQQGQNAAAEATWRALMETRGPANRIYERLLQLARARRDYAAGLRMLREWQAFDPQNPQVAYLLGSYLSVSQPDEAMSLLVEASAKDSAYTPAVQTLRAGLGMLSTSSDPAYGWLMVGRALGRNDQWDLALEAFQKSTSAAPNYAEAWAFTGEARYHLDGGGKSELDRAAELNGDSAVVRALQALYWRRQGQPDKALPYLEAIAKQEPQEPIWQVEIGNTLVETGDLIAARDNFVNAVNLAPTDSLYWQYLARFSVENSVDIHGLGLPAARQAVLLKEDDPGALDVMGWTLANLGDTASAERFLQRALERDATYALACLHLGQVYLQEQDAAHAYPYLKRTIRLAGQTSPGEIARRLLQRYFGEGG